REKPDKQVRLFHTLAPENGVRRTRDEDTRSRVPCQSPVLGTSGGELIYLTDANSLRNPMFMRLKRYFLAGLGLRSFFCFAFLELGGGGVAIIRFTASSKLMPCNLKSLIFGIGKSVLVLTGADFSAFLLPSKGQSQNSQLTSR